MEQMYVIDRNDFHRLFQLLQQFGPVHAPVRVSDQSYSFKTVEHPEEIAFEYLRTILPPKKYFYPQSETILTYNQNGMQSTTPPEQQIVLFGLHPCDLAGLQVMDEIFSAPPGDPHYLSRRRQVLIVGLSCMPDKHCFCKSMNTDQLRGGYDLKACWY